MFENVGRRVRSIFETGDKPAAEVVLRGVGTNDESRRLHEAIAERAERQDDARNRPSGDQPCR